MPSAERSSDRSSIVPSHLDAIVDGPGPKKLLSIDGGGIRGLIALEFLARIESLLRERYGRSDLVLADYFDYVGGTSTGAILATLISFGHSMDEIREFYVRGARLMFEPANVFQRIARGSKGPLAPLVGLIGILLADPEIFTPNKLSDAIRARCGADTTLGSAMLRTLLMIVMRNVSTDSPWWISNNPRAKFNQPSIGEDGRLCSNLDIPLWKLIRASTAAPIFFPPEEITIPGSRRPFIFQDGGVTVHNNPAFQLFLMATLPPYNLCWPTGEKNLLLVSVGTGLCESGAPNLKVDQMKLLYNAQALPATLMRGATNEQDLLCRVFGRMHPSSSIAPWDSEIGTLIENAFPARDKLFAYARYNVELSEKGLSGLGLAERIDPKSVQPLDGVKHVAELRKIGAAAAAKSVSIEDFDGFLATRPASLLVGEPPDVVLTGTGQQAG
jgi:predicted acylesterase/phospholipase RssA